MTRVGDRFSRNWFNFHVFFTSKCAAFRPCWLGISRQYQNHREMGNMYYNIPRIRPRLVKWMFTYRISVWKNLGPHFCNINIISRKSNILGVCASHLLCPTYEKGGGTTYRHFWVCVSVPPRFFFSVPSNGIKRVGLIWAPWS